MTTSSTSSSLPDLRGFLAGTLSGLTKLAVGHPFDTIKLRLQCTSPGQYSGPLDCLIQTIRKEGPRALYKGASPPAIGWAISDAILMGSLDRYRAWLSSLTGTHPKSLSIASHGLAGAMAGWTVCAVVTPIETLKAKLQMQTSDPRTKLYTGPIDCAKQIIQKNGFKGFYKALPATLLFRTWFGVMFGSYSIIVSNLPTSLSIGTRDFLAGGLSAEVFWIFSCPFDAIKNRMMCDSITNPKYPTWLSAARSIWLQGRFTAFYRGFVPCALRAFPTNAAALFVWERTMRLMRED
ncbi:mitochondrial carrier domain-containing protein [Melampsora americana]|nr:mitochondrial carrier domain-containing protein [Melampsora americana]